MAAFSIRRVGGNTSLESVTNGAGNEEPVHQISVCALPTGASTSALQTTGNGTLTSILAAFASLATTAAVGLVQTAVEAVTAAIVARFGTLGQKAMAGSAPVVIANDQSAVPVSGTVAISSIAAGSNIIGSIRVAHEVLTTWIDAASNADSTHTIADTVLRGMNELWLHIRLPSVTSGNLQFEGSLDGTNWFPLRPDPGVVIGLVASEVVLGTGATANRITLTAPAAAVSVVVPFDSPPPHVRVAYDNTGGGSATVGTFAAGYSARAA